MYVLRLVSQCGAPTPGRGSPSPAAPADSTPVFAGSTRRSPDGGVSVTLAPVGLGEGGDDGGGVSSSITSWRSVGLAVSNTLVASGSVDGWPKSGQRSTGAAGGVG